MFLRLYRPAGAGQLSQWTRFTCSSPVIGVFGTHRRLAARLARDVRSFLPLATSDTALSTNPVRLLIARDHVSGTHRCSLASHERFNPLRAAPSGHERRPTTRKKWGRPLRAEVEGRAVDGR
jgi:hypothetical protein